jgi:hypothetical protein
VATLREGKPTATLSQREVLEADLAMLSQREVLEVIWLRSASVSYRGRVLSVVVGVAFPWGKALNS